MRHAIRIQPYLSRDLFQKLRAYTAARSETVSGVVAAALSQYLERDQPDEDLLARRLDRVTHSVEQLGRDLDALGVGFGRFVRYSLWTLPEKVDDKTIQRGEGRYRTFTTRLLPDPPPEPSERPRLRMAATEFRELELVGARGFEPPTFRSRTERATRLRHAPSVKCEAGRYAGTVDLPNLPSPVNGPGEMTGQFRGNRTRRRKTSTKNSRAVASRTGVFSGCRVSRPSRAAS